MTAADRMKGAWFARWGNWGIRIAWVGDAWETKVWRWRRGRSIAAQFLLAAEQGFPTSSAAINWAWEAMEKDGARIFVLGAPKSFSPASVLPFHPTSEACA